MPSGLELVVEHLKDTIERMETKVDRLQEEIAPLKSMKEDIAELKSDVQSLRDDQRALTQVVSKWKAGAALLFALGGVFVWMFDHWTSLKRFIGL